MLAELSIENIAVISRARIRFDVGLNIFTGETGAGKSILIGAIGAALGSRTSKDLIRTGENRARVSALFTGLSARTAQRLASLGIDIEEGELLLSREITPDGNLCRINGVSATVAQLRAAGALLLQTHGQQDSWLLSQEETHLGFIDQFGALEGERKAYYGAYDRMRRLQAKLDSLESDASARARKIDLLRYQINEIEAASLQEGEEESLLSRRRLIRNAEKLTELFSHCYMLLSGGEETPGAVAALSDAADDLEAVGKYAPEFSQQAETVRGYQYELDDLAGSLRDQIEELQFDPRELDALEERLEWIGKLKKKYGATITEILSFAKQASQELDELESFEEDASVLTQQLEEAREIARKSAAALTEHRIRAAKELTRLVEQQLKELDMPYAKMEVSLTAKPLAEDGADVAEFLLSVNPGEALKPLAKIASGGEMSRIMLGIKGVLSGKEEIGTLIFDEIDAGISGRAASKVGAKLRAASRGRQIICVTHLAQVAAYGEHHLLIEKAVSDGRTFTEIKPLDETGRISELARIMNGEPITPLALENARELLTRVQAETRDEQTI
ncbi:MAG: DNA repair protein RecN [Oscillospiraceae bacterium]|nr:MAG: DNA repair protein RecN [Oscillospiraceae bacterium]